MKKLFLACCLLFIQHAFFAQLIPVKTPETPTQYHELGINLFCITYHHDFGKVSYQYNALPGIYYKFHFGQNALRFSADLYQSNINEIGADWFKNFSNKDIYNTRERQIKVGYQRQFFRGVFRPFIYADLMYFQQKYSFTYPPGYTHNVYADNAGMALGFGFKWKLSRHLALSYEFSFIDAIDLSYLKHSGWKQDFITTTQPVRQLGLSFTF